MRLPGDIFHQGQLLNNTYEIEGVLGRGGTGEVYRARNQISGPDRGDQGAEFAVFRE